MNPRPLAPETSTLPTALHLDNIPMFFYNIGIIAKLNFFVNILFDVLFVKLSRQILLKANASVVNFLCSILAYISVVPRLIVYARKVALVAGVS